jgi:arylsulfatase A-like enzyme
VLAELDLSRTTVVLCGDHGERLDEDYAQNAAAGGTEARVLDCYRRFLQANPGPMNFDAWFAVAREELGEAQARIYAHNVLGHGFHLTEDLVRVPLVIVDGGERCAPASTNRQLASQLDLAATLLDLAGVTNAVPGESLLSQAEPDAIYVEANGSGGKAHASRCHLRGVRTKRWKYWRLEGGSEPHACLWDLESDPRETTDVSEVHPDVAKQLDRETTRWTDRKAAGAAGAITADEERLLEETLKGLGYL